MIIKEFLDSWMGKSAKTVEIIGSTYVYDGPSDSVPQELKGLEADDYEFKTKDGFNPSRLVINTFLEDYSRITLKDFLNLCQNPDTTVVVKLAGEGRIYSGTVRELKDYNDVLTLPTMSCPVRKFFISTEEAESTLYVDIERG